jgi:hypothetical protein
VTARPSVASSYGCGIRPSTNHNGAQPELQFVEKLLNGSSLAAYKR